VFQKDLIHNVQYDMAGLHDLFDLIAQKGEEAEVQRGHKGLTPLELADLVQDYFKQKAMDRLIPTAFRANEQTSATDDDTQPADAPLHKWWTHDHFWNSKGKEPVATA
jgi:uncharacterized membrane-anchored protein